MSQSAYTLRAAVLTDLPHLQKFEQGVVEAERPYSPHLRPGPAAYYDLPGLIASPDAELVVAEANGQLIGCGFARIDTQETYFAPAKICYLGFMYLEPDFRGMGLISKVFEALAAWSRSRAVDEFTLNVYAQNESAIKAYQKLGFKANMTEMRLSAQ